jgi:uncharacterized repeat protein (TIGR01451 family)
MKKITEISVILAIFLIISSFSNVGANPKLLSINSINGSAPIDVSKKVWDGDEWVDSVVHHYGDSVIFNITITYNKNCEGGLWATMIQAVDTLPSFLEYNTSIAYKPDSINDNVLIWNLTDVHGIYLEDNESVSVVYEAIVVEYGEDTNSVEVTGWEEGCDNNLYGADSAEVIISPPVLINKEIYDPNTDEWVNEYFGPVTKAEPLIFRLNVTYFGFYDIHLIKCMIVEDILPDCLEYIGNEEFIYPDNMLFHDPLITVSEDKTHITYDWTNKKFNLFAGDSIYIQFEASVSEYSYSIVENCAFVELWNCFNCPDPLILEAIDCVKLHCFPPEPVFEKKVMDPDTGEWVEEISVYVGDTVTYNVQLTYYGNDYYSEISILDQLHCTMAFIEGSANPPATQISGNLIWWNFSDPLNDSETIEIEFQTEAVEGTGCGSSPNMVEFTGLENNGIITLNDNAFVKVFSNLPPCPPFITGDNFGYEGDELEFKAITEDFDGDKVYYKFDWNDGTYSDWLGPYNSGQEIKVKNVWQNVGIYNVRAKAKDEFLGEESDWSYYPAKVEIDPPLMPSIDIIFKPGFGLSVKVNIKNTGEVDFQNVKWNLTIQRMGLFKRILWQSDDIIPYFPVGNQVTVEGNPSSLGLIMVTMRVTAPGMDPVEFSIDGYIFSRMIYLK